MLVFQLKSRSKTVGLAIDPSYPVYDDAPEKKTRKIDVQAPIAKVQEIKPAAANSTNVEKPTKDLRNLVYRKVKE